jgi:hypothetical protein
MRKNLIVLLAVLCAAPMSGQNKKNVAVYVTADFLAELSKEQRCQRSDTVAGRLIKNAATCNKKDKPVDQNGCCEGLTNIDGVCRDLSGDIYWLPKRMCPQIYLAQLMPKVTLDKKAVCPVGYRVATAEDLQCPALLIAAPHLFTDSNLWTAEARLTYSGDTGYKAWERSYRDQAGNEKREWCNNGDRDCQHYSYSYACVCE